MASDRDMDLRWDLPCHPRFSITCSSVSRNLLSLRYVDNRLWISERRFEQLPGVRLFLNSRFYGGDIILEDEPAYDIVTGFSLDLHYRIHYNRACQARDSPSTYSASQCSSVACWQEPTPSRSVLIPRHKHFRISDICEPRRGTWSPNSCLCIQGKVLAITVKQCLASQRAKET